MTASTHAVATAAQATLMVLTTTATAYDADRSPLSIPLSDLPCRGLTAEELGTLCAHARVDDVLAGPGWGPILPNTNCEYDAFGIVYTGATTAWVRASCGWWRIYSAAGRHPERAVVAVEEYEANQQADLDTGLTGAQRGTRHD